MTSDILPLKGRRILLTRAKNQVEEFMRKIEAVGGIPIPTPLIEVRANEQNEPLIKEKLHLLRNYDCIVFTSANGVTFFKEYIDKWKIPYEHLNHLIAASVGSKTSKQMEKLNLSVTIIPEEFVAEKLADHIVENLPIKSKILVIRGNLARPVLVERLKQNGYDVTDLIVYETIHHNDEADKLKGYIKNKQLDYITFTSSSTVNSFMKVLNQGELQANLKDITFICIGPITNKTLLEYGLKGFMPETYTVDDMIKRIIELEQK